MSIANDALRSIAKQASQSEPQLCTVAYLRGAIDAMENYFSPDAALVREARDAVSILFARAQREPP